MKDDKSPPPYNGTSPDDYNPYATTSPNASKKGSGMVPSGLMNQFSAIDEVSEENSSSDVTGRLSDDDSDSSDGSSTWLQGCQTKSKAVCTTYSSQITKIVIALCLILYTVYFVAAIRYSMELAEILIYCTVIVVVCIVYMFIRDTFGDTISKKVFDPIGTFLSKHWHILQW